MEKISDSFKEKFGQILSKKMATDSIPGMSVAIVKDGNLIYTRGFGARNLQNNLPVTPDTLFGVGSCTKSLTSLAIMQLSERGLIKIKDPVSKYLPLTVDQGGKPITIHHLMSMSSGLPNLGVAEQVIFRFVGGREKYIPISSVEDLIQHVNDAEEEIAADPGERMFYLNSGYTLLGEIVARVSGKSFAEFIEEEILKPLQMNRSTFSREKFSKDEDIMTPYLQETKEENTFSKPSDHPFHLFMEGPGGLLSSAREMANYLIFKMNGKTSHGQKLLGTNNLKEMFEIHCETEDSRNSLSPFGRSGYGYGWSIQEDFFGHRMISHGGSTGVSSAYLAFLPVKKVGIAAAANVGGLPVTVLQAALLELIGQKMEDFPAIKAEEKMDKLTGKYEIYKGITEVSVVNKNGLLFLEGQQGSYPLIPKNNDLEENLFYIYSGPGQKSIVEFREKSPGEIDLFVERNRFHKK